MINLLEAFLVRYSPLETAVDLIFQSLVQLNPLKRRFKFPLSGHLRVSSFILFFFLLLLLLAQTSNPQPLEETFNHLELLISGLFFASRGQHTYIWLLDGSSLRAQLGSVHAKQIVFSLDHLGAFF